MVTAELLKDRVGRVGTVEVRSILIEDGEVEEVLVAVSPRKGSLPVQLRLPIENVQGFPTDPEEARKLRGRSISVKLTGVDVRYGRISIEIRPGFLEESAR
jgi:hypothetical protein